MVPSMCNCPISGRPERWHFWLYIKLNTTKSRHRTMILCIFSILYLFIDTYFTSVQASDTCYYTIQMTIQMTMYRENKLLAQAHMHLEHTFACNNANMHAVCLTLSFTHTCAHVCMQTHTLTLFFMVIYDIEYVKLHVKLPYCLLYFLSDTFVHERIQQ